jgi:drug/metabolite transporter (DMT)-like permease
MALREMQPNSGERLKIEIFTLTGWLSFFFVHDAIYLIFLDIDYQRVSNKLVLYILACILCAAAVMIFSIALFYNPSEPRARNRRVRIICTGVGLSFSSPSTSPMP